MKLPFVDAPSASDPRESLADWLELRAICASDQDSSREDLVRVVRRSASTEGLTTGDDLDRDMGSEASQSVADDAFAEIEDRLQACGGAGGSYPFEVGAGFIQLREGFEESAYIFQLLLTYSGPMLGQRRPRESRAEVIFEEICVEAARSYFGGRAVGFGFPRTRAHASFPTAITHLCSELGEGGGCSQVGARARPADAKLDVVAWRDFLDRREGKLIGFGQCAAGADWKDKLSELDHVAFCKKWLREFPAVDPVRMFFVPRRVGRPEWRHIAIDGGLLFDRCRISHHADKLSEGLSERAATWTRTAMNRARSQ